MRFHDVMSHATKPALLLALGCCGLAAPLGAEDVWWWEEGKWVLYRDTPDKPNLKPIQVPHGADSLPGDFHPDYRPDGNPGLGNLGPSGGYSTPTTPEGPPRPGQGMPPAPPPPAEPPSSGDGWVPPFFWKILKLGGGVAGGVWMFLQGTELGHDDMVRPGDGDDWVGGDDPDGGGSWGEPDPEPKPLPKANG
jgi:hypothetical protein